MTETTTRCLGDKMPSKTVQTPTTSCRHRSSGTTRSRVHRQCLRPSIRSSGVSFKLHNMRTTAYTHDPFSPWRPVEAIHHYARRVACCRLCCVLHACCAFARVFEVVFLSAVARRDLAVPSNRPGAGKHRPSTLVLAHTCCPPAGQPASLLHSRPPARTHCTTLRRDARSGVLRESA